MNFERPLKLRSMRGGPLAQSFLHSMAPAVVVGVSLGIAAVLSGGPIFAFFLAVGVSTSFTVLIHVVSCENSGWSWTARTLEAAQWLRGLSKSIQFLLIAFVITSVFALELRYDVVPNRYGFLELILPVALSAILFDLSGGLFCAALTTGYAFQALAPPRFAAVIETNLSWQVSLATFTIAAVCAGIFFAAEARTLHRGREGELVSAAHTLRRFRADAAHALQRSYERLKTHVLPAAALVILYALLWAGFATVSTGRGLHGDSLEAYAWGREFVFGYYKHPPFWSWVAGAWFSIMPRNNFSFWLLSELNGGIGLAGAWALMGRFANRRMQMLGVLILMLTPFYQFNAQRFNANTILLSLWPWTLYFFVRSVETRTIRHAAICGLLAGFAILSKYFGVILIATCFFAALAHASRRLYFASAAPYVSAMIAFVVFLPHLVWLFRDGFQPLLYLANRIDVADRAISNYYFEFIAGNIAFFIAPSLVLLFARWRRGRETAPPLITDNHDASFFYVLAFAPFVLTLVAGTVGHATLGIPFAVPIFALIPLALLWLLNPNIEAAAQVSRIGVGTLLAACLIAAPFLPFLYLRFDTKHYSEPRQEIADYAIALWHSETGAPLRFVTGDRDFALAAVFRSPDNTSEFNNFNFRWSPWVTLASIREHGLLAICQPTQAECNAAASSYMRDGSKMIPVTLQREVWGAKGLPWPMNLYLIRPAPQN